MLSLGADLVEGPLPRGHGVAVACENPPVVTDLRSNGAIWAGVGRLVDRAPTLSDLRVHRLEPLAARHWRSMRATVPPEFVAEERVGAVLTLLAPLVLEKMSAAYDGPMLLMKGPEVAACYPDPVLRPFRDLDVLVTDAPKAYQAFLRAGFEPVGRPDSYYVDLHHLRPLHWPGVPLLVEVHRRPEWVEWTTPPSASELFSAAVPAAVGIEGVLALPPAHHALVLAAHSWSTSPLRRLLDIIDVAVVSEGVDRDEMRSLARQWAMYRMWDLTIAAADALLFDERVPWALRVWARDLPEVRDRTVLENHIRRLVSSFWVLPPGKALRMAMRAVGREVRPARGETWRLKLARTRRALPNAFTRLSDHGR